MEIKAKINKWDLIKLKKLLHNEGNYKQGEKTAFRVQRRKEFFSEEKRIARRD